MARKKVLVRNPFGNRQTRRQLAAARAASSAAVDTTTVPPSSAAATTTGPPSSSQTIAALTIAPSSTVVSSTSVSPSTFVVHFEETHAVVTRVIPSMATEEPPINPPSQPISTPLSTITTTATSPVDTLTAPLPQYTTTDATTVTITTTLPPKSLIPELLLAAQTHHATNLENPQPRLNAAGDYRNPLFGTPLSDPEVVTSGVQSSHHTPPSPPVSTSADDSTSSGSPSPSPERHPEKQKAPPSDSTQEYQPESPVRSKRKRGKAVVSGNRKRSKKTPVTPRTRSSSKPPAVDRYTVLPPSKILMERCFDPQLIATYAHIQHHLVAYQWENAIPHPGKANASWLREFYSAIRGSNATMVVIRGRKINFGAPALSRTFGMTVPKICKFTELMDSLDEASSLDIARTLMLPQFLKDFDPTKLSISSGTLNMEASLWFPFLRHNLMPSTHDATLSKEKCILLFCILKELPFNFGPIALDALRIAASRSGSWIIFPILLTKLMQAAKVPSRQSDEMCTGVSRIDQGTVQRLLRSGRFTEAAHPASGVAATSIPVSTPPVTGPSTSQRFPSNDSDTVYGNETWLMVLSQQKEEELGVLRTIQAQLTNMQERLQEHGDRLAGLEARSARFWAYQRDWNRVVRSFYFKSDAVRASTFPRFPSGLCPPQVIIPTSTPASVATEVATSSADATVTTSAATISATTVAGSPVGPSAQVSEP